MGASRSVSFEQLQSAYRDVQRELTRVGLWHDGNRLTSTEVFWCSLAPPDLSDAFGFFIYKDHHLYRASGYEPGHIYVPKRVVSPGSWRARGSLRDVLRHEFGHALAYHRPGLIRRSRAFREAFGARYDEIWACEVPGHQTDFITPYAMTSPMEDFAETFMVWLRTQSRVGIKGSKFRPRSRKLSPVLEAKFSFVHELCGKLAN